MDTVTIPREEYEELIQLAAKVEQIDEVIHEPMNELVKKRSRERTANPSIGKSEDELDAYLKQRGVKVG